MSSTTTKLSADRAQKDLIELASQPGNDICADCKTRNPRWASYNLGIFLCVGCAGIHRKMGTHISKVKSLTLDIWTKEQLETMKQIGNIKSNFVFNPNESRHPPPINAVDQERDSELEKFIRSKYQFKSFVDRAALVASKLGPSRSATGKLASSKSDTKLASASPSTVGLASAKPAPAVSQTSLKSTAASTSTPASSLVAAAKQPVRSVSHPVPIPSSPPQAPPRANTLLASSTFNDLVVLQAPVNDASLPLQYAQPSFGVNPSMALSSPMSITASASSPSYLTTPGLYGNISASPSFPSQLIQTSGVSPGGIGRSMSLGADLSSQMGGLSLNTPSVSPYQQPQFLPNSTLATQRTPSPNPFATQLVSQTPNVGLGLNTGMTTAYNLAPAPQTYMIQQQPQQPAQMFQPQPQQLQVPGTASPYTYTPSPTGSPFMGATQYSNTPSPFVTSQSLPYTGQPSPYVAAQPLPQMQQPQHQQQLNYAASPFTSWIQQGPQGTGYAGQQWGGV